MFPFFLAVHQFSNQIPTSPNFNRSKPFPPLYPIQFLSLTQEKEDAEASKSHVPHKRILIMHSQGPKSRKVNLQRNPTHIVQFQREVNSQRLGKRCNVLFCHLPYSPLSYDFDRLGWAHELVLDGLR